MSTGFEGDNELLLEFSIRLVSNATAVVIAMLIIALIVKLMRKSNGDEDGEDEAVRANENSRLLSSKEEALFPSYGTSIEDDHYCLESGKWSSGSCEDLYDGKICVICYDDETNCLFVPCGHSVACHTCANRILNEESKSCPICRGLIHNYSRWKLLFNDLMPEHYSEAMAMELEDLDELRMQAYNSLLLQKIKVTRIYNQRVKKKAFEEGDVVWKVILQFGAKGREFGKWSPNWRDHSKFTRSSW